MMNYVFERASFLTKPTDYLEGSGSGVLDPLQGTLEGTLSDVYKLLTAIGIGLIVCALVVAFICFGILKDSTTIRENKQWIVRLIIAVIGISCVLTIVGLANGIGNSIKASGTGKNSSVVTQAPENP